MNAEELEPVIGLEVHVQLSTLSKMFCGCSAAYSSAPPNTHVCAVCGGMPGALPVINRQAVEDTIRTAVALQCRVPDICKFDRKNYSYPDLPKGYQITQYDQPIGSGGSLDFEVGNVAERCGIVRVHLEEDTGKLVHTGAEEGGATLVDYNRSGVPLMEIVGEPHLHTPAAAREYFAALRRVLMYLGVSDGNLQEGSMRADVNVSLRRSDGSYGTKVEIKNLNSFRAVERALVYELERQREMIGRGEVIEQETRGWSEHLDATFGQRSKEYAHDYRYFPEPDLPPLGIPVAVVERLRADLPELPAARRQRFITDLGLPPQMADVLIDDREVADFYEAVLAEARGVPPSEAANWVSGEILRLRKEQPGTVGVLTPSRVAGLVTLAAAGSLSVTAGKAVLEAMTLSDESADEAARRLDLLQIRDDDVLQVLVDDVIAANAGAVADYRRGKRNAAQALIGRVMGASKGKADPGRVRELLLARLEED